MNNKVVNKINIKEIPSIPKPKQYWILDVKTTCFKYKNW